MTSTFEVTAHVGDASHHTLSVYMFEVHRPSSSKDMANFQQWH